MIFRKISEVKVVGGDIKVGQNVLPMSVSPKVKFSISANHSSISFSKHFNQKCHSFGRKQFANKPEVKKQGSDCDRVTLDRNLPGLQHFQVPFMRMLYLLPVILNVIFYVRNLKSGVPATELHLFL